jgi:hypothetical protein
MLSIMKQKSNRFFRPGRLALCALVSIVGPLVPFPSKAQSAATSTLPTPPANVEDEIRVLRQEVLELRGEVTSLRDELHRRDDQSVASDRAETAQALPNPSNNAAPAQNESNLAATVGLVQSQVEQLAQTKVESSSKWPVTIYGTILSTTFYNTHDVDWADLPFKVDQNSGVYSAGAFSSSLRQTRIGLEVDGPTVGSFKSSGVFAMDFMGGQTDFLATPLFGLANIVYAYARLDNGSTVFEAGQDHMILAPQNPTSLVAYSYPELWEAGNLYIRAPQLRVEQKLVNSREGQMWLTLGLVAPVGTYPLLDFPGSSANSTLRPSVQGRLSWRSAPPGSAEKSGWEAGFSGTYGRVNLPLVDTSGNVVSSFSGASYAGAFDFNAHYHKVGFDGEGYLGQNLENFGGGIGQPGRAIGGYFEGRLNLTQRLSFNSGLGVDHLLKPDRIPVVLNRNTGLFANTIFHFKPEVAASLEYRYMETRPFIGVIRRNGNVSLGIAYSF